MLRIILLLLVAASPTLLLSAGTVNVLPMKPVAGQPITLEYRPDATIAKDLESAGNVHAVVYAFEIHDEIPDAIEVPLKYDGQRWSGTVSLPASVVYSVVKVGVPGNYDTNKDQFWGVRAHDKTGRPVEGACFKEGQFYMGAWAAAGIGIHWDGPRALVLVTMALAGFAAGAAWIAVPALARAYWGVNEIITTLLLNFVAIQIVAWFSFDIWRDKKAAVIQSTPPVKSILPLFFGSSTLYIGVFVPLIIAGVLYAVFRSSRWGFEVDLIGGNPRAAAFAGIRVRRRIVVVMLLSGALAGLSGMLHLAGPAKRLSSSISTNYGLSGFIVAALAGASVIGVIGGAVFIATMLHAGIRLQSDGLSLYIVTAIYGLVLLGIALGEVAARFRLVRAAAVPINSGAPA